MKYFLFGKDGAKELAKYGETVLLGQIPLIQEVGDSNDSGVPLMLDDQHMAKPFFMETVDNLIQQLNIRNEVLGKTQIVKMNG